MGLYIFVNNEDRVTKRRVSDNDLNEIFQEALQYAPFLIIEEQRRVRRSFFGKRTEYISYSVYHETPAHDGSVYQARLQMSASGSKPIVVAYLYGIINGALAVNRK